MNSRIIRTTVLAGIGGLFALCSGSAVAASTFVLDPKGTFLRTQGDAANTPRVIELRTLGLAAGQFVELVALGAYDNGPSDDVVNTTVAVFSSQPALAGPATPNRVIGAIDAGVDFVTARTFNGNLVTDIPQDFLVSRTGVVVQIPAGANWLFVGAADSLYRDNTDPNRDYAVSIGLSPVPEPESWALLLAGLAGLGWVGRRRAAGRR